MKNFLVMITVCLALFACNNEKDTAKETKAVKETKAMEVSFETIAQDSFCAQKERKNVAVTNTEEWKKVWASAFPADNPKKEMPKQMAQVDFKAHTVVAVFQGEKTSGGYSIEVTKVMKKGDTLTITIKETSPEPGGMAIMAMSQPCHLVKVAAAAPKVEFVYAETKK